MNQEVIAAVVTSILAALGAKELLLYFVKRWGKNNDDKNDEIKKLINENRKELKDLLGEVKKELEIKRKIELELREKYSECRTRLELLIKELTV